LVPIELRLRRVEQISRNDCGHINGDPLLGSAIPMSRLCMAWHRWLVANRTKKSSTLDRFRLSEGRFPHMCRVSQDGPYRRAIPAWTPATCGHTLSVEGTNDLADGFLLANERLEDASNHLRLMQQDAIAGGSIVGLLHVQEP